MIRCQRDLKHPCSTGHILSQLPLLDPNLCSLFIIWREDTRAVACLFSQSQVDSVAMTPPVPFQEGGADRPKACRPLHHSSVRGGEASHAESVSSTDAIAANSPLAAIACPFGAKTVHWSRTDGSVQASPNSALGAIPDEETRIFGKADHSRERLNSFSTVHPLHGAHGKVIPMIWHHCSRRMGTRPFCAHSLRSSRHISPARNRLRQPPTIGGSRPCAAFLKFLQRSRVADRGPARWCRAQAGAHTGATGLRRSSAWSRCCVRSLTRAIARCSG